MKIKSLALLSIVLVTCLLVGCAPDAHDWAVNAMVNEATLKTNGDYMGTLPDGREVRRYRIENARYYPHYVYVVKGAATQTTNHLVTAGKTTYNQVDVVAQD